MSPSENAAFGALMSKRGFKVLGDIPADSKAITKEHISLICGGDVKGALRDLINISISRQSAEPEPVAS